MKTRRLRNSTKRMLVYLSILMLYVLVFSNILLKEKPPGQLQSFTARAPDPR